MARTPLDRPSSRAPEPRQDRITWLAVVATLILALGLIPFYLLTPVHEAFQRRPAPSPPTPLSRPTVAGPATPTTAPARSATAVRVIATPVPDTAPPAVETPIPLPTSAAGDARFAFLLLGYGGGNHEGSDLTDSLMVVIVDPERKALTLLSLPRDSWVPLLFDGKTAVYSKVNSAYAFAKDPALYPDRLARYTGDHGAGTFAADTVSQLLGVPVSYYLALDFQGFREMIDAVGGIDVNVPEGFAARYPANDDPAIDPNWKVVQFNAGEQHFDGERAIEYARARETIDDSQEGSDFARSRRQRLIIEAFKTRLLQPAGLIHLPQLLGIASRHVDSNYPLPAAGGLTQLILDWKDVQIYQTALTGANYLEEATGPDGAYLLVPNAPDHSWAQIRAFARRLWKDPALGVAMAATTVAIENDSGAVGLDDRLATDLRRLGYQVEARGQGQLRARTVLVDQTGGAAAPLVRQLVADLTLPIDDRAESNESAPTQILLQLGSDAAELQLAVPEDETAPSSVVGVVKFGVWPWIPSPTPRPILPEVRPTPRPTATPSPVHPLPVPTSAPSTGLSTIVVVPNLVGMPEAQAQQAINDAGLMTTYVNYQTINDVADKDYFRSIAPGAVLSQLPPPGTKVPRGTRVALAVRKS